jgi:GWxTD domain-containing protein
MRRAVLIAVLSLGLAASAMAQAPVLRAADSLLAAGHVAEARQLLEARMSRRDHAARFALARLYAAPGPARDPGRAYSLVQRALELSPRTAAYLDLRLALEQEGEGVAGLPVFLRRQQRSDTAKRLLRLDSTNARANLELGRQALDDFLAFRDRYVTRMAGLPSRSRAQPRLDLDYLIGSGALMPEGRAARPLRTARLHLGRVARYAPGFEGAFEARATLAVALRDFRALLGLARNAGSAGADTLRSALYGATALFRLGRAAEAERAFDAVLARLPDAERAAYLDLARLLSPDDAGTFRLEGDRFARDFWSAADPRRLTRENERRAEHFARITEADLLFATGDTPGRDTAPGRVYVRYGGPERRALIPNLYRGDRQYPLVWLWDYGDFQLTFGHTGLFADAGIGAVDVYSPPASAMRDEGAQRDDNVARVARLERSTPEQTTYALPVTAQVPVQTYAFRDGGGRTEVIVAFGVPLVPEVSGQGDVNLPVRTAVTVFDGLRAVAAEQRRSYARLADTSTVAHPEGHLWIGAETFRLDVGPAVLHVEFDALQGRVGGYERVPMSVPAMGSALRLSDLLLAHRAVPDSAGMPFGYVRRGRQAYLPSADGVFARAEPLHAYVEAYGLGQRSGRTDYEIETALLPVRGRDRRGGITTRFASGGVGPDAAYPVRLDAARLAPGEYTLTIRFHDRVTGRSTEASRPVTLF